MISSKMFLFFCFFWDLVVHLYLFHHSWLHPLYLLSKIWGFPPCMRNLLTLHLVPWFFVYYDRKSSHLVTLSCKYDFWLFLGPLLYLPIFSFRNFVPIWLLKGLSNFSFLEYWSNFVFPLKSSISFFLFSFYNFYINFCLTISLVSYF